MGTIGKRTLLVGALLLTPLVTMAGTALADGRTRLEATTTMALEQDACLDHTVKELGMSAKRKDKERTWVIGPQFLHPSLLPDGTVQVDMIRSAQNTTVMVALSWAGARKEKAIESEIEQRAAAMVNKMAQMCGTTKPAIKCTTTTGSDTATCAYAP